jgi:hypothetical protein
MSDSVLITFDCLPLRSIGRLDIPLDASPEYRARCERLKTAFEQQGARNGYYLLNASCVFHLANSDIEGMLRFEFEGTVITDPGDAKSVDADLNVVPGSHTCGDVPSAVAAWFQQQVAKAVMVEFDRYIAAGELSAAVQASEERRRQCETDAGFIGMYL